MDREITKSVQDRYGAGAIAREAELCCPVNYNGQYLEALPTEVIERDYGCGDPSVYIREGDVVLDLGSGTGKICFIAAQVVGPKGRVIGIDMTDEMLDLSRGAAPQVAQNIGYANVEFKRGKIQDLKTDLAKLDHYLREHPVASAEDYQALEEFVATQWRDAPMIADNSIDVIVSNCVLNLVSDTEKNALFAEIYRVLKPGGRVAVSDITSDRESPAEMKADPDLWSGCISGAMQEREFVAALEAAGFHGTTVESRAEIPWQVVNGIEYRSVTLRAWKAVENIDPNSAADCELAAIYKGPWASVRDDDGREYVRGQRVPVSRNGYDRLTNEPYANHIIGTEPSPDGAPAKSECC